MFFALVPTLAILTWPASTIAEFSISNYLPSWPDPSSTVSGGIRYVSNAAELAWGLLKNLDTEDVLDAETYVPDVSPISTDPNDIRFLLYTDPKFAKNLLLTVAADFKLLEANSPLWFFCSNPSKFQVLAYNNHDSIRGSSYGRSKPVKKLVHGFTNNLQLNVSTEC